MISVAKIRRLSGTSKCFGDYFSYVHERVSFYVEFKNTNDKSIDKNGEKFGEVNKRAQKVD